MNVVKIAAVEREGAERRLPDVVRSALDAATDGHPAAVFERDALTEIAKLHSEFPAWATLVEAAKVAGVRTGDLERAVKLRLRSATPVPSATLGGMVGQSTKLDQAGLALRLARLWRHELRHVRGLGWLDCDDDGAVRTEKRVRRAIDGRVAGEWPLAMGVRTAGVTRELAGGLDSPLDGWGAADVLALPNGRALDLATGQVRRAQPSERVYQRLSVAPEGGEPSEWLRVLGETFSQLEIPDETIAYARVWVSGAHLA